MMKSPFVLHTQDGQLGSCLMRLFSKTWSFDDIFFTLFVCGLLYGNIDIGIIIPLCTLILPFIFMKKRHFIADNANIIAILLLVGILFIPFIQKSSGNSSYFTQDLKIYTPAFYAILTILAFSGFVINEKVFLRAFLLGGSINALVMIGMALFAEPGSNLLRGQNVNEILVVEAQRLEKIKSAEVQPGVASGGEFVVTAKDNIDSKYNSNNIEVVNEEDDTILSPQQRNIIQTNQHSNVTAEFYKIKNQYRNALGSSNYLAVFFLFLCVIFLYTQNYFYAVIFGTLIVLVVSRYIMLILLFAVIVYAFERLKIVSNTTSLAILTILIALMASTFYINRDFLVQYPSLISASLRFESWNQAFSQMYTHPIIGIPRSTVVEALGSNILYNPHNTIIFFLLFTGGLGTTLYTAYYYLILKRRFSNRKSSNLENGLFVATVILIFCGMFEIVNFTAAFEILMALLFSIKMERNAIAENSKGQVQIDDR